MIRDEELKRVQKYAQGLGITVIYKDAVQDSPAADWATDGSEITLYLTGRETKTMLILNLIHELGHHMNWVHSGRKTAIKLENALDADVAGKATKKQRKAILDDEINGALYHVLIWKELGLKVPLWKVELERDHQIMIYRHIYRTGINPSRALRRLMRAKLMKKYKLK